MKITKLAATVVMISGLAAGAAVAQAKCCGSAHEGKSCAEAHQTANATDVEASAEAKRDAEAARPSAQGGEPSEATATGAKRAGQALDQASRLSSLDHKGEPRPKIMKLRH